MEAAARSDDLQIRGGPLVGLAQARGPRRYEAAGKPIDSGGIDDAGRHAILAVSDAFVLWAVTEAKSTAKIPRTGEVVGISGDGTRVAYDDAGRVVVAAWDTG